MRIPDSYELHKRARQWRSEEMARLVALLATVVGKKLRRVFGQTRRAARRANAALRTSPLADFQRGARSAVRCSESIR